MMAARMAADTVAERRASRVVPAMLTEETLLAAGIGERGSEPGEHHVVSTLEK